MASQRRRVLIVEDEMIVSMLLEDLLQELDYEPVGPAARLDEALALAREAVVDVALLDVNLNGKETYAVAEVLDERGIPFVFATGYGAGGIPEAHRHRPVLSKPFRHRDLAAALAKAMGGAG
jgi:CheY-like chemotaxis protein